MDKKRKDLAPARSSPQVAVPCGEETPLVGTNTRGLATARLALLLRPSSHLSKRGSLPPLHLRTATRKKDFLLSLDLPCSVLNRKNGDRGDPKFWFRFEPETLVIKRKRLASE